MPTGEGDVRLTQKVTPEMLELVFKWNLVPLFLGVLVLLLGGGVDIWKLSTNHVQGVGQYTILSVGSILVIFGLITNGFDQIRRQTGEKDLIDVTTIGIEIDSPLRDGESIETVPITISGRFKEWPKDRKLWLFSEREEVFFPHKPLAREAADRWSASYWTDNAKPRKRTLYIYAVGKDGQAQIETYFRCCSTIQRLSPTEQWPGMTSLGPDFQICAQRIIFYDRMAA